MNNFTIKISFSVFFVFAIGVFVSGCTSEDDLGKPIIPWIEKEGTAKAVDVAFDFENLLFKSAKEVHSYTASLKSEVLTGTFQVNNFDADGIAVSDASGDITCMVFEDDCKTTRFVGVITSGSDPTYLGMYAVWTVFDDGAALKETTDIRYPVEEATAKWHCDGGLELEWYGLPSLIPVAAGVKIESESCQ